MLSRIVSVLAVFSVAACTASVNEVPAPQAPSSVLSFVPSNVALSEIDFADAGDLVIANDCGIDTDSGAIGCVTGGRAVFKILTPSNALVAAVPLGVFIVRSLRLESGARLRVRGSNALVIIAQEDVAIAGSLLVNATSRDTVAGGFTNSLLDSPGAGPGAGGAGQPTAAGAGASFCGSGGDGASEDGAAPAKAGAVYGAPSLVPLMPGSSGGQGNIGQAGGGGGAVQLTAGHTLTVAASGIIHAGGGGGGPGGTPRGQNASGGGSGGAILIEGSTVVIDGTLAANGGGGGQGSVFAYGADSSADAVVASGGNKDGTGTSVGGDGGAGRTPDGKAGSVSPGMTAGGGGGGAGRIRINSELGSDVHSAASTVSPLLAPCTTYGEVAH